MPFEFADIKHINTNKISFGNVVTVKRNKRKFEKYKLLGPVEFELDLYPMIITYQLILVKKFTEKSGR